MITIFLTMLFICSNAISSDERFVIREEYFITPEREAFLNTLKKDVDPLLTCLESKRGSTKDIDCLKLLEIFSAPMEDYLIIKNWRKWEKQQERFDLLAPVIISLDKTEQAESQYSDNFKKSFAKLKEKYPVIKNACSHESMGITADFHLFKDFRNALEKRVSLIVESLSYKHPGKEDLSAFKDALHKTTKTAEGRQRVNQYKETLNKIANQYAIDRATTNLIKDLALLDPASKEFYEKYVLHKDVSLPVYDLELIDLTIAEFLIEDIFEHKIVKIK